MDEEPNETKSIQRSNSSTNDRARMNSSSMISNSSFQSVNDENCETIVKIDDIQLSQTKLQEKIKDLQNATVPQDEFDAYRKQTERFQPLLTYVNGLNEFEEEFSGENWRFFRRFIWHFCSDMNHWKSVAHAIYRVEHLINHFDNYQIKEFLQKPLKILLNNFTLFMKDLITAQIKFDHEEKEKAKELSDSKDLPMASVSKTKSLNIDLKDQIDQRTHNLKNHANTFRELILTTNERFTLCKTDITAVQTLLQAFDQINFDSKEFDSHDRDNIRLLALKETLAEKSNKTDLIQFKHYIDSQVKQLIELNKQNAKELERIKLLKSATCEARHIQTVLSSQLSSRSPKSTRTHVHQSSRPYITFELAHIRDYQRQALLKAPSGTIPLYRRQAWAAANLLPDHSLPFLRYTQQSLRMQVHHLLGYDPSDICSKIRKKKKANIIETFNSSQDVSVVGSNNKLYRGRVDVCEVMQPKDGKKSKSGIRTNLDNRSEAIQINFDQLNQTNRTIMDEQLFEYLDWQRNFDEQDLPDELCEELFHHWKSILCEDQPCLCPSDPNLIPCLRSQDEDQPQINQQPMTSSSSTTSTNDIDEDRCICSECSCACEKYTNDESICLCSQCSCECLKASPKESSIEHEHVSQENDKKDSSLLPNNQINIHRELQVFPANRESIVKQIENNETMVSDCFLNRIDQWTEQFDLLQDVINQSNSSPTDENRSAGQSVPSPPIAVVFDENCKRSALDDPTMFRQRILDHYRQRTQTH